MTKETLNDINKKHNGADWSHSFEDTSIRKDTLLEMLQNLEERIKCIENPDTRHSTTELMSTFKGIFTRLSMIEESITKLEKRRKK